MKSLPILAIVAAGLVGACTYKHETVERPVAPAATVVASVTIALDLAGPSQMAPQRASARFVGPDMQVDRLVAHDAHSFHPQAADNLLGTEVLAEHALNRSEVRRSVAAIVPGAAAAKAAAKDEGSREKAAAKAEIEQEVSRAREALSLIAFSIAAIPS